MGKWLDCRARTTSKGTCTTPFCEKWHPPECLFYKSDNGCRFGEKCSYAHRLVDEQPSKKSKTNVDKIAVAFLKNTRQLGTSHGSRCPSVCLISSIHEVSVSSDFLDLFITFIFLLSFLINLKQFLLPFNFPEVK